MEEIVDATKDMLLADIGKRDKDNFNLVFKSCNEYQFRNLKEATFFISDILKKCLMKFNVNINEVLKHKALDPLLFGENETKIVGGTSIFKNVRIERRPYFEPEYRIRSGFYLYYRNEIAYFISEPFHSSQIKTKFEQTMKIRKAKTPRMTVFTNFK